MKALVSQISRLNLEVCAAFWECLLRSKTLFPVHATNRSAALVCAAGQPFASGTIVRALRKSDPAVADGIGVDVVETFSRELNPPALTISEQSLFCRDFRKARITPAKREGCGATARRRRRRRGMPIFHRATDVSRPMLTLFSAS